MIGANLSSFSSEKLIDKLIDEAKMVGRHEEFEQFVVLHQDPLLLRALEGLKVHWVSNVTKLAKLKEEVLRRLKRRKEGEQERRGEEADSVYMCPGGIPLPEPCQNK